MDCIEVASDSGQPQSSQSQGLYDYGMAQAVVCSRPCARYRHRRSGSTAGAPAIVQIYPVAISQGIALAGATYALLTKSQKANLALAYDKCINFIQTCGGFLGQKSFYGRYRDNNRFDVDSYGISPNFVS
jgi:hypothetical protein